MSRPDYDIPKLLADAKKRIELDNKTKEVKDTRRENTRRENQFTKAGEAVMNTTNMT